MKALLIIWIGFGNSQSLAIDHFDSVEECLSASAVLRQYAMTAKISCLPYGHDPRFAAPIPKSK